jgi:Flp pilus assembly protein TadD
MKPLDWPDAHHLEAAAGWLGLGNHVEAFDELENITPQLRAHPDVLKLRWRIYAKAKHWQAAAHVATGLVTMLPNDPEMWLNRSFALHEMKRTQEARDLLLPAASKFPKEATVFYNLACYECQLGDLSAAEDWLKRAFGMKGSKQLKLDALDDPDLEPLWEQIGLL